MSEGHSVQGTLSLVYRLQTMDLEVFRLTADMQEAADQVQVASNLVSDLEAQAVAATQELASLESRRRQIDLDLQETERLLADGKKRQKDLKHPRDIQAYLSEMEFRRDEKDRMEEEILKNLESQDQLKKRVSEIEAELARSRHDLSVLKSEKEKENRERDEKLAALAREKMDVEQSFPEDLLKTYTRLKGSHRNGMVVARLLDGACEACRMSLPPRTVTEVKKKQKIVTCLFCQRWLFLPDRGTEGERVFQGSSEKGAAPAK
ncbi:MAG: zinc ribbon domain-containing protein [Leptospirillum sp.]